MFFSLLKDPHMVAKSYFLWMENKTRKHGEQIHDKMLLTVLFSI